MVWGRGWLGEDPVPSTSAWCLGGSSRRPLRGFCFVARIFPTRPQVLEGPHSEAAGAQWRAASPQRWLWRESRLSVNLGSWHLGAQARVSRGCGQALCRVVAVSVLSGCTRWPVCRRRFRGEQTGTRVPVPSCPEGQGPPAWACMPSISVFWMRML